MGSFGDGVMNLPYLTAELPGIGGVIKRYDEDFVVEEIPLYEAGGSGTHVYFTIEKRGLTTPVAIGMIANALGRKPRDIGYAGLKDAHGVTRQRLSLEHVDEDRVRGLDLGRVRVLSVARHSNKIKLGHLAGNRFVIRIRESGEGIAAVGGRSGVVGSRPDVTSGKPVAQAVVDVLARRGVPNYFGPQRFGARGDNARIGVAVLRGDYDEALRWMLGRPTADERADIRRARELFEAGDLEGAARAWPRGFGEYARVCRALKRTGSAKKAWQAVGHSQRKFYFSAVQSALFNRVLAARIHEIDRVEVGDVAWIHRNGACFLAEDASAEQPRCSAFEISPSGPLFGRRLKEAQGRPGEIEAAVLSESGLGRDELRAKDGTRLDGARRPLRVPLGEAAVSEGRDDRGAYVELRFVLPPGAYATSVTREVCKA